MPFLTSLTASIAASLQFKAVAANTALNDTASSQSIDRSQAFDFGTASAQVNEEHTAVYELAASGTLSLKLNEASSGLYNLVRDPDIRFATVKYLFVALLTANADASAVSTEISINTDATNPVTLWFADPSDKINLLNGDFWMIGGATGRAVAANKVLKITNLDATRKATVLVCIGGVKP